MQAGISRMDVFDGTDRAFRWYKMSHPASPDPGAHRLAAPLDRRRYSCARLLSCRPCLPAGQPPHRMPAAGAGIAPGQVIPYRRLGEEDRIRIISLADSPAIQNDQQHALGLTPFMITCEASSRSYASGWGMPSTCRTSGQHPPGCHPEWQYPYAAGDRSG